MTQEAPGGRFGYDAEEARDREAIFELARMERFARDRGDWEGLQASFWPEARIRTTWFDGLPPDFVAGSRRMRESGGISRHEITPMTAAVVGDRALVESNGQILVRLPVGGVPCDITAWARFFSRVQRRGGVWRLASWDAIYVKDRLDAVDWTRPPTVEWEQAAACRASYRFLQYTLRAGGAESSDDLPGEDRQDILVAFYRDAEHWLALELERD